jgi:hypothetical protein
VGNSTAYSNHAIGFTLDVNRATFGELANEGCMMRQNTHDAINSRNGDRGDLHGQGAVWSDKVKGKGHA